MENNKLIMMLIKDDLINNKLVDSLNEMGLEADHYHLYLSEIIFHMMGFTIDHTNFDRVYCYYGKLTKNSRAIDIRKQKGRMDQLAEEVYNGLRELKDVIEKEKRPLDFDRCL